MEKKCALCIVNKPDKKNTHFLTDAIIRSCLNLGGSTEREKGFYFDFSNNTPFISLNFQRNTSQGRLEDVLGRLPNEAEVEKAKTIPFSVDYVFCSDCETIFTEIEQSFTSSILLKFRNSSMDNTHECVISENTIIRLFFLLQVWRTSICTEVFKINPDAQEKLRLLILKHKQINENDLKEFPLLITYLQTIGDNIEFTRNMVGYTNDKEPNLILMNDFVIQYFNDYNEKKFFDFYNLNEIETFDNFVNYKEQIFKVRIFNNQQRLVFLSTFLETERVKFTVKQIEDFFSTYWFLLFGYKPPQRTVDEFNFKLFRNQKDVFQKFTKEYVVEFVKHFIIEKIR